MFFAVDWSYIKETCKHHNKTDFQMEPTGMYETRKTYTQLENTSERTAKIDNKATTWKEA